MANWHIKRSRLSGSLALPPSKSQTLRALLFASFAEGESHLSNCLASPDTEAMVRACCSLGAVIRQSGNGYLVTGTAGQLGAAENVIDAGNSGIVLRFMTAVSALSSYPIVVTGDRSLRHQRPMQPLLDALQQMGAQAISTKKDGYAPIIVQGPLRSTAAHVQGEDSQFVSALLIAMALFGEGELTVSNPGEKPWVELTLEWLRRLHVACLNESYKRFSLKRKDTLYSFDYTVPGDLSSMAFPLVAALITGSSLTITNVNMDDGQGDKRVVEILRRMGASISYEGCSLTIHEGNMLSGADIDVNDCIDALPILAVAGCYASGTTRLTNAAVARNKECDRLSVMAAQLRCLGAQIEESPDGLVIHQSALRAATVSAHHDHRVAMALAVAAMGASGETAITGTECAAKTYPRFVKEMVGLGANMGESQ